MNDLVYKLRTTPMSYIEQIHTIIQAVVSQHVPGAGKTSNSRLDPSLTAALIANGFDARKQRLPGPISLGFLPGSESRTKTLAHATMDIGVFKNDENVGIIECEADVAWVRKPGERFPGSSAATGYTMSSIARDGLGEHFVSYAPLERMAYTAIWNGSAESTRDLLLTLKSNRPDDHNPRGLALFLVVERADVRLNLLQSRLNSLGAKALVTGHQ